MTSDIRPTSIRRPRLWLLALVLFAAGVRLIGLNWDDRHHFHPDERAIAEAVQRLSFDFRDPQLNPKFFAYGSLPIYATRAASGLLGLFDPTWRHYDELILTGRGVSAVVGTFTVILLVFLGARLYDRQVGLLAGFLLGACVLHIQNSHFMTTDIFLTLAVLLCLHCLVGVVQRGWTRDYVYAGLAMGLALATKASAAPLLAPLGVAVLVRLYRERRLLPVAGRALAALLAAAGAFAAGEPYALLDFAHFSRDVLEQSRMVRNAGMLPYTNQYVGTAKYGYDLAQLVLWGMAPPLGLAAVWATATRAVGAVRERSAEHLVLLAWVLPFFLVTGWFEVKFIRYLLPIYPIMILWAAAWLWQKSRTSRLGRLTLWVVVAGTFASALAFLSVYQRPHTVVAASEWAYRHLPAGSVLLSQHWDEGFPLGRPPYRPDRFTVIDLPYYEPDNSAKIQRISRELAGGDYIVFQTKRLYGAVTRAPEKYPLTNKYFYLLFAGDLGYTLIYDHASRPGLFGFEFPDELADESFTVYDHPKVLIFQNTERLSADEIAEHITGSRPPSKKLTRTDLLLAQAGERGMLAANGGAPPVRSSWPALLWFAIVVEVLGLSVYPLVRRGLPVSGSYALAKVLGVLAFAYVTWLLAGLGLAGFTRSTLMAAFVALAGCGLIARRWPAPAPASREWWPTELLFWGAFAFFLAIRAFNPEVFWGEKPMDFAFLNTLTRSTRIPPPEPWFAGSTLHYSYFGHYLVAALGKLCHLHPGLTFNLGIALIAGLTTTAAFALGCAISGGWRVGVLAALFSTLLGNLAGVREVLARKMINFDYFWATSRVIKDTINEYPFWSFLFADLHAHVLVMPFSLTFLTLSVWWVQRGSEPARPGAVPLLVLLGLTLGAVMVTNSWSSPTYILFFPFLLGCVALAEAGAGWSRSIFTVLARTVLPAAAVVGLAYGLYYPFWRHYSPPEPNWGLEFDAFANFHDYATIFGLFLFVAVPFLFVVWRQQLLPPGRERLGARRALPMWIVGLTAAGALLLSLPALRRAIALSTAGSVRTGLIVLAVLALHLALRRSVAPRHRLISIMLSFAFFVTAGCDLVHVWDRMNTIFKFYLEAWFLFAAATAAAAYELWRGLIRTRGLRYAWQAGLILLVAVAEFTAGSATYGLLTTRRVQTPRPTLDGTAYLARRDPHESAAFEWLNQNIAGIPVITEAYGPSYQDFARVSMNTGLPTVLGWDYHVFQRAHRWPDINRRKADLQKLYTDENKSAAAAVLKKYHVSLVYVGPLERRTYAGANLERFQEWADLLTPIYQNAGVTVLGVNGQFTGAMPVTTIEEVPREAEEVAVAQPQAPPSQFRQPRGLAVDSQGHVYVADFDNHRIQKFTPQLEFVIAWGEEGSLPGQFKQPCGITIDDQDTVYVADTWNQRVQVFDADGKYLREWGGPYFGPRGITISRSGKVFLADTGNHRIRRYDTAGNEERSWGGVGTEPGQFKEPVGVTTDADERVYVCDNGNARVQIFDADGNFLTAFPVDGWESQAFSEPNITVTPAGAIWVSVPRRGMIRAYDRRGALLHEIDGRREPAKLFVTPMGIVYSPLARELVVADLENKLVRIPAPEDARD